MSDTVPLSADPEDPLRISDQTRNLGLVVCKLGQAPGISCMQVAYFVIGFVTI